VVHEVEETRRYRGCVSWVELDQAIDVGGADPVLDANDGAARLDQLIRALGDPDSA
jgi:hypothetical protein